MDISSLDTCRVPSLADKSALATTERPAAAAAARELAERREPAEHRAATDQAAPEAVSAPG